MGLKFHNGTISGLPGSSLHARMENQATKATGTRLSSYERIFLRSCLCIALAPVAGRRLRKEAAFRSLPIGPQLQTCGVALLLPFLDNRL